MKKILYFGAMCLTMQTPAIAQDFKRIIAIGGSAAETIVALGSEKSIIAVDITVKYPPSLTKLPNVGYIRAINAENIIALSPDAVITSDTFGPKNQVDLLKQTPIKIYTFKTMNTMQDLYDRTLNLGAFIGKKKQAEKLVTNLKKKHTAFQSKLSKIKKPVRVMGVMYSKKGIYVAGENTSLGRIITLSGGENSLQGIPKYSIISQESILKNNPDVIVVLGHRVQKDGSFKAILSNPSIQRTNAYKNNRIHIINSFLALSNGPRTVEAMTMLGKLFYPKHFK